MDQHEKPYEFVPLPQETGERGFAAAAGHHAALAMSGEALLTGSLTAAIVAATHLGVASGRVVPLDEVLQYGDIAEDSLGDDTIVLEHTRSRGRRIIPGTSLKGAIRSAVEAISYTGTTFTPVPRERTRRSSGRQVNVTEIRNRAEQPAFTRGPAPPRLSLSARLFGITSGRSGYQGHCFFADAVQTGGQGRIFRRLPLYSPQPDYSQSLPELETRWQLYFADAGRRRFRGRKFYATGEPREVEPPYNAAEVCAAGATFAFTLRFERLAPAELGALLIVLGAGGTIPQLRLGGGKPLALGALRFEQLALSLATPARYLDFDAGADEPADPAPYVGAALASDDLFAEGLARLGEIATRRASYTAGGEDRNY